MRVITLIWIHKHCVPVKHRDHVIELFPSAPDSFALVYCIVLYVWCIKSLHTP